MSCNGESFIIIPYANIITRQAILTYIPILLLYMYTINETADTISNDTNTIPYNVTLTE